MIEIHQAVEERANLVARQADRALGNHRPSVEQLASPVKCLPAFNAAMSLKACDRLVGLLIDEAHDEVGPDECLALPPKWLWCPGFHR